MPANKKTRKEQASKQEVSPTCSHTYTHQKKTQTNAQPFKQNLAASIPSESARSTSQLSPASHPRGSCCTRGESSEHISTNNKGARSRKRTQHTHNKSRGEEERREERKPPCTSTLEPWPSPKNCSKRGLLVRFRGPLQLGLLVGQLRLQSTPLKLLQVTILQRVLSSARIQHVMASKHRSMCVCGWMCVRVCARACVCVSVCLSLSLDLSLSLSLSLDLSVSRPLCLSTSLSRPLSLCLFSNSFSSAPPTLLFWLFFICVCSFFRTKTAWGKEAKSWMGMT